MTSIEIQVSDSLNSPPPFPPLVQEGTISPRDRSLLWLVQV